MNKEESKLSQMKIIEQDTKKRKKKPEIIIPKMQED